MKFVKLAACLLLFSAYGASADTPERLGSRAATSEKAYFVFGQNADAHAATFMKAWVEGCKLAKGDMLSDAHRAFIKAYVEELTGEPGAAARKPLQKYVRDNWWKSGLGCETVAKETPEWALK